MGLDCNDPTLIDNDARRRIAVDQPPGAGDHYPFVGLSELQQHVADFYLSYVDEACEFVRPFSIAWIRGLGCDGYDSVSESAYENRLDLAVIDAEGQTVFDSRDATAFDEQEWSDTLHVAQWETANAVCRLVAFVGWPEDVTPETLPAYFEPSESGAILDERTIEQGLPHVRSMRVDAGSEIVDALRWQYGHNLTFEVETPEPAEGERRRTYITVNVVPGTGRGLFPADCEDETQRVITRINGVEADADGNFRLDAGGCHRLERPVFEELEGGVRRAFAVIDHTLKLFNDCGPCCSCDDFINTYEGVRRLRDRYADLYQRANAVRAKYIENLDRFASQRECRINDPLRLTLTPLCGGDLGVGITFCNNTGRCLNNLILPISFEYNDVAGDTYPGTDDPVVFETEYAAGIPYIQPSSIFRAGNQGGQGSARIPQLYSLGGEYPWYYAAFDRVDPGSAASITFRLRLPLSVTTDAVRLAIDVYEGPGDLSGYPSLAIPIPGYTPGGGPVTLDAKNRRLTTNMKIAESGILQDCGEGVSSVSE